MKSAAGPGTTGCLDLFKERVESLAELGAGQRGQQFLAQVDAEHLGYREDEFVAFDEVVRQLPEAFAEIACFVGDRKPHILEDLQIPLDLPLAALEPFSQVVGAEAVVIGLHRLEQIPLPNERFAA